MAVLYEIGVEKIESKTAVRLNLRVVHQDAMHIPHSAGFALMLLQESSNPGDPIAAEVDYKSATSPEWVSKYALGYVPRVEVVRIENERPDDWSSWEFERQGGPGCYDNFDWPEATLRLEVSDPAWIAHLSEGKSWESTAYEPGQNFEPCAPVRFEEATESATTSATDDSHQGMVAVPRVFCLERLREFDDEVVWFPKYGEAAYLPVEVFEGSAITDALLESLVGELVLSESRYVNNFGMLIPGNRILHFTQSTDGWARVNPVRLSVMRFNPKKKRLPEPFSWSKKAPWMDPAVFDVRVDGDTVVLSVYVFDTGSELNVKHETQALALIAALEYDSGDGFARATSKLAVLLNARAGEQGLSSEGQIYKTFAKGVILDFKIEKTKDAQEVDFDALAVDELRATLAEHPWDVWRVEIKVSDPGFLEHLPGAVPFAGSNLNAHREAEPWDGPPLRVG